MAVSTEKGCLELWLWPLSLTACPLRLWIGDYARLQQPSSNTGREEQRTRRKQCGHRWVRPCSSLTQARAPSQAQTSPHHTVATTESLPNSGLFTARSCEHANGQSRLGCGGKSTPGAPHGVTQKSCLEAGQSLELSLIRSKRDLRGSCEGQPHPVCH